LYKAVHTDSSCFIRLYLRGIPDGRDAAAEPARSLVGWSRMFRDDPGIPPSTEPELNQTVNQVLSTLASQRRRFDSAGVGSSMNVRRSRLTDAVVMALKPAAKECEVHDTLRDVTCLP
jgi:hypothetical protein